MKPIFVTIPIFALIFAIASSMPTTKLASDTSTKPASEIDLDLNVKSVALTNDEKRIVNALKVLQLLNEEDNGDQQDTDDEEKEEEDFDDFLVTLLAEMDRHKEKIVNATNKRKQLTTTSTTTTTEKIMVELNDTEVDDEDDADFDEFLATLLVNMDKHNPFVLHKQKIQDINSKKNQALKAANSDNAEEDLDEILVNLLTNMDKHKQKVVNISNKRKQPATLSPRLLDEIADEIVEEETLKTEQNDEEFVDFLATLLGSMDKRNPFVLHKEKIPELNSNKQAETSSTTTLASSLPSSTEKQAQQVSLLRTNLKAKTQQEPASQVVSDNVDTVKTKQNSSSESTLAVFGIVSSIIALIMSIVSMAAICSVVYYRRSPKQLPLLSPRFPLFSSPSDGFSTIYKNRKFNIPKKSRKEAEEYKKSCEQQQQYLQERKQLELASPEVDEAHYGTHDFLNASLSSI